MDSSRDYWKMGVTAVVLVQPGIDPAELPVTVAKGQWA